MTKLYKLTDKWLSDEDRTAWAAEATAEAAAEAEAWAAEATAEAAAEAEAWAAEAARASRASRAATKLDLIHIIEQI